eukprot:3564699-Rhodomonas_salina.1
MDRVVLRQGVWCCLLRIGWYCGAVSATDFLVLRCGICIGFSGTEAGGMVKPGARTRRDEERCSL